MRRGGEKGDRERERGSNGENKESGGQDIFQQIPRAYANTGPVEFIASSGPRCNYLHSDILERVSPPAFEQRNVREIADKFP